jgi:hypothetical protein
LQEPIRHHSERDSRGHGHRNGGMVARFFSDDRQSTAGETSHFTSRSSIRPLWSLWCFQLAGHDPVRWHAQTVLAFGGSAVGAGNPRWRTDQPAPACHPPPRLTRRWPLGPSIWGPARQLGRHYDNGVIIDPRRLDFAASGPLSPAVACRSP